MNQFRPPRNRPEQAPQPSGKYIIPVRLPVVRPRLVYLLLGTIVLIFMYYFSLSVVQRNEFLYNWAKINQLIRQGEYYRLVSAMFLHLNLAHLAFNGYALYVIGRDVESLFGHVRFMLIYLLGGLSASLASFVFTSAPSVGASGAIFAIFGAELVYFYQHRHLHGEAGRQHLKQLVFVMLLNLGLGFFSSAADFRIDNAGHIGGLVGGVVLALLIGPTYVITPDPAAEHGLRAVDDNPFKRWAQPVMFYTVGLVALLIYAVSA